MIILWWARLGLDLLGLVAAVVLGYAAWIWIHDVTAQPVVFNPGKKDKS